MQERFAIGEKAWFCLRSKPKQEHIAAAQLRECEDLEVFVPRIRFQRSTRRGAALVTEALFPTYLFARFNFGRSHRQVCSSRAVSDVVHFGRHWPTIPDEIISQLRACFGPDEIHFIPTALSPGDEVRIVGGTFDGFQAVVSQVMPAATRVAVLLDLLGRQTTVQLSPQNLVRDCNFRRAFEQSPLST